MPSGGLNVALYQSDSGLHADRLFESSQQPAPRGRFYYHHFTNEERLREFNQVTRSQNLESNLGVSDFSAGVLTLMLHREVDRKYGLFLLGDVSSFKDKNQITYLDLGGSSRSMISAP